MKTPIIPITYEQWKHCITVECGIPLTRDFVEARLAVWRDDTQEEVQRFIKLYGLAHLKSIRQWFEQALAQINAGNPP